MKEELLGNNYGPNQIQFLRTSLSPSAQSLSIGGQYNRLGSPQDPIVCLTGYGTDTIYRENSDSNYVNLM